MRGDLRFQLMGPWPVCGGALTIPAGMLLSTDLAAGVPNFVYQGMILTEPLPINVMALDQPSADQLAAWYSDQLYRLFALPPAVIKPPGNV